MALRLVLAVILLSALASTHAAPALHLSNIFSSNMVLQRAPQQAVMWGTGAPASQLTISIDSQLAAGSTVGSDGRWSVQLPAQQASTNHTIIITDTITSLTLNNVAFGDVYLCSGQSNMQVTLNYSFGGAEAIANASSYPNLRLFNVPPQYSNTTVDEATISYADGWVLPSASTLQDPYSWSDSWLFFSATCYWSGMKIYDSLNGTIPIGLLQASFGGTCAAAWTSPDTNTVCGPIVTPVGTDNTPYNQPSVLYNAMIHPLLPLRLRAVLWYQGETDWWDADRYACSFPNLINDFRTKFNQPWLPFYFVQTAPAADASYVIRESQKQALLLPMTGVASTVDLGDRGAPAGDVHPRNKSYVGERLALLVRRNLYGQQLEAQGPLLLRVRAFLSIASMFHVTLQYSDDGRSEGMFALPTPGCDSTATDARACCVQTGVSQYAGLIYYTYTTNGVTYTEASAVRIDNATRTITTTQQPPIMPVRGQPVLVSYATADWPGCALYNVHRLPALPFQLNVTVELDPPLTFANLFSSNMVLQRGKPAMLWGTGTPGRRVDVTATDLPDARGVVLANGEWRVYLQTKTAATDITITATDGVATLTLDNVAVGDVYLCSGQSNMQIVLNYSFGGAEAIANASSYPNIRLYSVPPQWSNTPVDQSNILSSLGANRLGYTSGWQVPSADTLQNAANPTDLWSYFSAVCWWTGVSIYDSLGDDAAPVGLLHSSVGATEIQAWNSYETISQCGQIIEPPQGTFDDVPRNQPSFLFNAMIHPLRYARFRLSAVVWYQGEEDNWKEANTQSAIDRYRCAFPNLIADWRTQLRSPLLPFYFVQLAPYTWSDDTTPSLIREAQLSGLQLPMTGVANTIDLGDMNAPSIVGDIHPRNKSYVGERLARWVRRDVYGQRIEVNGPQATEVTARLVVDSTALIVTVLYSFDAYNDGLFAMGTPDCVNATRYGCCTPVSNDTVSEGLLELTYPYQDGTVTTSAPVTFTVTESTRTLTLTLNSQLPKKGAWLAVAHAWQPFPGCALYNADRLPALPFRVNVTVRDGDAPPAVLRLNNYFSNNMVLQRAPQQAVVWGRGEPSKQVTVRVDEDELAATIVSASGDWSVRLPPHVKSESSTVVVSDGTTTITLANVAFGDVYLCSGQSNMMIVLNYSSGGADAIANASRYPNIRLFNIYMQNDTVPRNETGVSYSPDSWVLPSESTLQYTGNWQDVWDYFSAVCYWTGVHLYDALNGTVPLGLVHSSWGGTCIQAWTSADANEKCGPLITPPFVNSQNEPSVLYNAMIHPLTPMSLAGVLWYQGESDDFDIDRYACSFPNLIDDWRAAFHRPDLPFYFALLAPLGGSDSFVGLRRAQMTALQLRNVGVANTVDLGSLEVGQVHPTNKSYLGERFARLLRRDVYGEQVAAVGPQMADVTARLSDSQLHITVGFSTATSDGLSALATPGCANSSKYGCCTASGNQVDTGLLTVQHAVKDGYRTATGEVTINQAARTLSMTVSATDLPAAGQWVVVSHAWEGFPGCALYNADRLPALPFQLNVTVESVLVGRQVLDFDSYFSGYVVLQRAPHQAVVWGTGEPGQNVSVAVDNTTLVSTIVSVDGTWSVQLPPHEMSLSSTIVIADDLYTVTLDDVAFGDVYLCSGGSNMQINLNYSFGGADAIAAASSYTKLRLYNIPPQWANRTFDSASSSYADGWVLTSSATVQSASNWSDPWSYFSAVCYWTGVHIHDSLNGTVPIGLVQSSYNNTLVHTWTSADSVSKCGPLTYPPGPKSVVYNASVVYDAMIHPVLRARVAAVLWYQGESNWYDTDLYACAFSNMIQDWRTQFGYAELPFYFVLLAPFQGLPALLRAAQLDALGVANVGVANAIDLGDGGGSQGGTHPRNKSYVGERLARWVRRDIYQQQVEVNGPQLQSVTAVNVNAALTMTLHFSADRSSNGLFALATPDCDTTATDARGCCSQQGGLNRLITYSYALGNAVYSVSSPATIDADARTITVVATADGIPVAGGWVVVMYAYVDWPGCALYNADRLPALPFWVNVTVTRGIAPPAAVLRLNNYFSNNMVLQRTPQQAVVWGYGEPGRTITVQLDNSSAVSAIVSSTGSWSVQLPATNSSFSRSISVSDTNATVTLSNVAFGDVYLCSGQSNMQINLNYSFGGDAAIAAASQYSDIRLLNYYQSYNDTPLDESSQVSYRPDSWVLPATSTLQPTWNVTEVWAYFSATCYWTGVHISDSLNHTMPIGLVHASYGGTAVQAWTSPDTVDKCGPVTYPPGSANPVNNASVIYNAMIHPLLPMRFAAVLWYQGESDWFDIDRYACSFPNMIADWRVKFARPDLPFYFVLLSPYIGADPRLRVAQLAAWTGDNNIGVASAIDLGDRGGSWGSIHPRNKSFVGERLARWLRRDIYQQQSSPLGPEPITEANDILFTVNGTTATVVLSYHVTNVNAGLYMLPTPDCTTCCQGGAGALLVTINDPGNSNASATPYRPPITIDQQAYTVTATFSLSAPVSEQATAIIGLAAEAWPQCVLYNRYNVPALPFITTVPINGGSGGTDDSSSSSWVWAAAAAGVLLLVGVVIWLVVHYGRKRRAASADAEAGGYRDVDERRENLLGDDDASPS